MNLALFCKWEMQESELIEIILLICTLAFWGQNALLPHPEFPIVRLTLGRGGGGRGLGGVGTADELVLPELGQVRSLPLALCFFSSRRSSHWD